MNPSLFMLLFTFKRCSTHGPTKKYLIPDSVEEERKFVRSVDEVFPDKKKNLKQMDKIMAFTWAKFVVVAASMLLRTCYR